MYTVINFIALLVILYFLLRKPVVQAFVSRHNEYKKAVEEARNLLAQGTEKFDEYNSKLKSIDSEIDFIKKTTEKEAEQLSHKIIKNAEAISLDVVSEAKMRAQNLVKNFTKDVTVEITDKVIDEAQRIISSKITTDDHKRFQLDFSNRVAGGRV